MSNLMNQVLFYNLKKIPQFNFDKPWWSLSRLLEIEGRRESSEYVRLSLTRPDVREVVPRYIVQPFTRTGSGFFFPGNSDQRITLFRPIRFWERLRGIPQQYRGSNA